MQAFFKRVERLAYTVINYRRELIAQKLDDNGIHFLYARKFCRRSVSDVNASEQNRCSASVEGAALVCTSEACKCSISAIVMAAAMTSCSSAIMSIERYTSAFARKVFEQVVALIRGAARIFLRGG